MSRLEGRVRGQKPSPDGFDRHKSFGKGYMNRCRPKKKSAIEPKIGQPKEIHLTVSADAIATKAKQTVVKYAP